ncbi:MAG: hypothetical protein K5666_05055 [Bacilli bacterium]|nr:hypothetical protein [Bacilli bacterium]
MEEILTKIDQGMAFLVQQIAAQENNVLGSDLEAIEKYKTNLDQLEKYKALVIFSDKLNKLYDSRLNAKTNEEKDAADKAIEEFKKDSSNQQFFLNSYIIDLRIQDPKFFNDIIKNLGEVTIKAPDKFMEEVKAAEYEQAKTEKLNSYSPEQVDQIVNNYTSLADDDIAMTVQNLDMTKGEFVARQKEQKEQQINELYEKIYELQDKHDQLYNEYTDLGQTKPGNEPQEMYDAKKAEMDAVQAQIDDLYSQIGDLTDIVYPSETQEEISEEVKPEEEKEEEQASEEVKPEEEKEEEQVSEEVKPEEEKEEEQVSENIKPQEDNKFTELFSGDIGEGMPSIAEQFESATGIKFDPDKHEVVYDGVMDDGYDNPFTPFAIVEKPAKEEKKEDIKPETQYEEVEIFSGDIGEGMPSVEDQIRAAGIEYNPETQTIVYDGAMDDGYDNPFTPFRLVERRPITIGAEDVKPIEETPVEEKQEEVAEEIAQDETVQVADSVVKELEDQLQDLTASYYGNEISSEEFTARKDELEAQIAQASMANEDVKPQEEVVEEETVQTVSNEVKELEDQLQDLTASYYGNEMSSEEFTARKDELEAQIAQDSIANEEVKENEEQGLDDVKPVEEQASKEVKEAEETVQTQENSSESTGTPSGDDSNPAGDSTQGNEEQTQENEQVVGNNNTVDEQEEGEVKEEEKPSEEINPLAELSDNDIKREIDEIWRTVVSSGDEATEEESRRMDELVAEQARRRDALTQTKEETQAAIETPKPKQPSLEDLSDAEIQREIDELWRTVVSAGDGASEEESRRMDELLAEQTRRHDAIVQTQTAQDSLSNMTDAEIQREIDEIWRTVVSSGDEATEEESRRMDELASEQARRREAARTQNTPAQTEDIKPVENAEQTVGTQEEEPEIIFEGYIGEGMPTIAAQFEAATGEKFDPEKHEVVYDGAHDELEDEPYTPFQVVVKRPKKKDENPIKPSEDDDKKEKKPSEDDEQKEKKPSEDDEQKEKKPSEDDDEKEKKPSEDDDEKEKKPSEDDDEKEKKPSEDDDKKEITRIDPVTPRPIPPIDVPVNTPKKRSWDTIVSEIQSYENENGEREGIAFTVGNRKGISKSCIKVTQAMKSRVTQGRGNYIYAIAGSIGIPLTAFVTGIQKITGKIYTLFNRKAVDAANQIKENLSQLSEEDMETLIRDFNPAKVSRNRFLASISPLISDRINEYIETKYCKPLRERIVKNSEEISDRYVKLNELEAALRDAKPDEIANIQKQIIEITAGSAALIKQLQADKHDLAEHLHGGPGKHAAEETVKTSINHSVDRAGVFAKSINNADGFEFLSPIGKKEDAILEAIDIAETKPALAAFDPLSDSDLGAMYIEYLSNLQSAVAGSPEATELKEKVDILAREIGRRQTVVKADRDALRNYGEIEEEKIKETQHKASIFGTRSVGRYEWELMPTPANYNDDPLLAYTLTAIGTISLVKGVLDTIHNVNVQQQIRDVNAQNAQTNAQIGQSNQANIAANQANEQTMQGVRQAGADLEGHGDSFVQGTQQMMEKETILHRSTSEYSDMHRYHFKTSDPGYVADDAASHLQSHQDFDLVNATKAAQQSLNPYDALAASRLTLSQLGATRDSMMQQFITQIQNRTTTYDYQPLLESMQSVVNGQGITENMIDGMMATIKTGQDLQTVVNAAYQPIIAQFATAPDNIKMLVEELCALGALTAFASRAKDTLEKQIAYKEKTDEIRDKYIKVTMAKEAKRQEDQETMDEEQEDMSQGMSR